MSPDGSPPRWSLQGRPPRGWLFPLLIALVALGASVSGIGNRYAQDDTALIEEDTRVHDLAGWHQAFARPYWPPPATPDLYRPMATVSFALQWAIGDGAPVVFRLTSYLLYILASLAVYGLASRLLPRGIAAALGLLFAAHPVHVEAVALGVNQGEQWVGLLSVVATAFYLDRRREGWLGPAAWAAVWGLYLLACLFKEHAVVLPGFLLAAELTLLRGSGGAAGPRMKRLGPGFLGMALIGGGFLAIRSRVLGDFVGSFTAEALAGQSMGGRVLTMLQVVPRWLGLLVWPSHLQGDYSPSVINQATGWGWPQTLGAVVLLGVLLLTVLTWRRQPVVAFGVLWAGGALLPVSNILVPTGIVMAERTLYTPSIGFLLTVGALVQVLLAGRSDPRRAARWLAATCGTLVALGVARSAMRHLDWRNQLYYWAKTVEDAPLSYRAHLAHGQLLWGLGYEGASVSAFHTSFALFPKGWWIPNELGNRFRLRGDCHPALDLYAQSLEVNPDQPNTRASKIACLVYLARYDEAIAESEYAIALGRDVTDFAAYRFTADSARAAGAPPGSVQLPAPEAAVLR